MFIHFQRNSLYEILILVRFIQCIHRPLFPEVLHYNIYNLLLLTPNITSFTIISRPPLINRSFVSSFAETAGYLHNCVRKKNKLSIYFCQDFMCHVQMNLKILAILRQTVKFKRFKNVHQCCTNNYQTSHYLRRTKILTKDF